MTADDRFEDLWTAFLEGELDAAGFLDGVDDVLARDRAEQAPVMRRERILPRSEMNLRSVPTSL